MKKLVLLLLVCVFMPMSSYAMGNGNNNNNNGNGNGNNDVNNTNNLKLYNGNDEVVGEVVGISSSNSAHFAINDGEMNYVFRIISSSSPTESIINIEGLPGSGMFFTTSDCTGQGYFFPQSTLTPYIFLGSINFITMPDNKTIFLVDEDAPEEILFFTTFHDGNECRDYNFEQPGIPANPVLEVTDLLVPPYSIK